MRSTPMVKSWPVVRLIIRTLAKIPRLPAVVNFLPRTELFAVYRALLWYCGALVPGFTIMGIGPRKVGPRSLAMLLSVERGPREQQEVQGGDDGVGQEGDSGNEAEGDGHSNRAKNEGYHANIILQNDGFVNS